MPGEPGEPREPPLVVTEPARVSHQLVQLERLLPRGERLRQLVGQVALVGQGDEQRRPLGGAAAVPHGEAVVLRRLPVGAAVRGLLRGGDRMRHRGRFVAAAHGVMRESAMVLRGPFGEGAQRASVQLPTAHGREALLDGLSCQFMAEPQGAVDLDQRACVRAFVDGVQRLRGDACEQVGIGACTQDRRGRHHVLGGGSQPGDAGEDRVAHRGGQRHTADREALRDEESVPPGAQMERRRVHGIARVRDESRDPVDRQRRHEQSAHLRRRGEIAEQRGERMAGGDLVMPIGHDHEHGGRLDAPREIAERVQGRFIGPVQILEHQQCGSGGDQIPEFAEQPDPIPAGGDGRPDLGYRILERAERSRRCDVVSAADPHAAARACDPGECAHQSRLADSGLAAQEDDMTGSSERVVEIGDELGQEGIPFDEHVSIQPLRHPR